ncbi:MAG: hypothetical protein L6Q98_03375 [Anaerolineae bacterium]|nr:hypothetical protein [Anaerolineae bacterium]NUQ02363.1 hypothetical protein [Anaerolineae bacterium]
MANRRILLLFLDGIGIGEDDASINPFAAAAMPTLLGLTNGRRWVKGIGREKHPRAAFVPTDPRLGVPGKPQSATGQAAILTGVNVPEAIGEHYGPRPNAPIRAIVSQHTFFKEVTAAGENAALLEGYPPAWHAAVNRGKRLLASYQQAAFDAGLTLFDEGHIQRGEALAVDWTGETWRSHLGFTDSPLYTPYEAGEHLADLARRYTFSLFPHWLTDTVGHRGTIEEGMKLLELFDGVMAGVLDRWNDGEGLIVITSDHGNMEDLSHGKHTENDVPTLIIGEGASGFADAINTLADFVPAMRRYLHLSEEVLLS